jgi:hypothetical protein
MDEERPSFTAHGTAVMRAIHQTLKGVPTIVDDPVGLRLFDSQSDIYKSRLDLVERLPKPTRLLFKVTFLMRSRFAEHCLTKSISDGMRRDARRPDWMLERAEFEPSSPFSSHSVGDLVDIWILRRRNRLDEKDSVRVGPNPDPARQSDPVYFLSPF